MYEAKLGRFISADTVDPKPENPQTLNRYSYCLNNPLKYIDPTGHDAYDAFFIALDLVAYQENPTFLNAVGLGIDIIFAAAPVIPALGGLSVRGLSKFSKADDIRRTSKLADSAGNIGKTVAKGEEFVHVAPIGKTTQKISKEGLKYEKSTWVTKAKYIEGKTPEELPKIVYKKEYQTRNIDKFKEGYSVFEVSPEAGKPIYKGLTTRPGGIPQWQYQKNISTKHLKKITEIK